MSDESGNGGHTVLLVIGGVFLVLGLGVAIGGSASAVDGMQTADAGVETDGTVVETNIQTEWEEDGTDQSEKQDEERVYYAQVTYNYTVEGETYTSSSWKVPPLATEPAGTEFESQQEAEAFLEDYEPGDSLTVYYLPEDPSQSFVEKPDYSPVELALPVAFGLPFVGIGAGSILYTRGVIGENWRSDEESATDDQSDDEWGTADGEWGTQEEQ